MAIAIEKEVRGGLVYAGAFSLGVNLLTLVPSLYMLQIFDRVLSSRSTETLGMLTIMAVGSILALGGLDVIRARICATAGFVVERRFGTPLFRFLLEDAADISRHTHHSSLRDIALVRSFLGSPAILSLMDFPWIPIYLLIIFLLHPLLGLFGLAATALLLTLAYATERLTRHPTIMLGQDSRIEQQFSDIAVRNAGVIHGLGMAHSVGYRWDALDRKRSDRQAALATIASALGASAKVARLLVQILLYVVGAVLVIDQKITAGTMLAASLLLGRALQPVESLVSTWKVLVETHEAYRRLLEQIRVLRERQVDEPMRLPAPVGSLRAEAVSLSIPEQEKPLLDGISFELGSGESLGLIGPSAAGKSCLARLLIGLWRPTTGTIRLDGGDISRWPREHLAPYIGFLPQDVELFTGTVAENIARFGGGDSESIIAAAKRANIHEMVMRLPDGYDTHIGEGGRILSGGQSQRIGLARALYGSPRLVVLDEPNANLDSEGEEALLSSMRRLKSEGVTVIVVSHRPSILADVDKLLVLNGGKLQAFGSREAIMRRVSGGSGARPAPLRTA